MLTYKVTYKTNYIYVKLLRLQSIMLFTRNMRYKYSQLSKISATVIHGTIEVAMITNFCYGPLTQYRYMNLSKAYLNV